SALAAVLIVTLRRTRFKNLAALVGIGAASILAVVAGWDSVRIVSDISRIPAGLPFPSLPDFSYVPELISSALALSILGAVQSAAIINALPDRGQKRPNVNRDFIGMGIGNVIGSLFQNMPSGGSLSRTAVNIASGAQTRLSNIFAGIFIALFLLLLGRQIEYVALAGLAVMLIIAASTMINLSEIRIVWKTAVSARIAMVTTFATALIFPIEYSIYAGVIISLLLYVTSSSEEVKLSQLIPLDGNRFKVAPVPEKLPDHGVVILSVTGHLYFAAITRLERLLPDPANSQESIVILRLRDSAFLATTGIHFLERYDAALRKQGGQLILTGLSTEMVDHIQHLPNRFSEMDVFSEDEILLGGTLRAYDYATSNLVSH
ncbi:MAG: SulP family inorganic anion transporter, partial [Anaerolineae bacterium]|nr:SulP family inorganic anion transporter [Anaerolineae bacterium]